MSRRPFKPVVFSLVSLTLLGAVLAFSASAGPSKGNAAEGKKVFTKCIACHKPDGSGGVKLTGNPTPSWKDKKRMATVTDDQLRECIVTGRPKSGMVSWKSQLKPADIENVIAYIRTLAK
jgi:mono/diheme cytochrome c family protein